MSFISTVTSRFRRAGLEVLGWILIPVGIVLMPLPGPGMLIVVSGVALLSHRHTWAQRALDPLQRRALEAAKYGVASGRRITLSILGGAWLFILGVIWWQSPTVPEFAVLGVGFGPDLPAAGWASAIGLWASAIAAWVLLAYSYARWHQPSGTARSNA